MQCGKIHCEDNRNDKAIFYFNNAINKFLEARNDKLAMEVLNEYGQNGTKKQLNLEIIPFSFNDD